MQHFIKLLHKKSDPNAIKPSQERHSAASEAKRSTKSPWRGEIYRVLVRTPYRLRLLIAKTEKQFSP